LNTSEAQFEEFNRTLLDYLDSGKGDVNKALLNSISSANVDLIRELIKRGADINTTNEFGSTPLKLAVAANNYQVVRFFLELGQNPNGDYLMSAAANGQLDLVKLLLQFGANPDYPGCGGNTALMSATAYPEIFKTLIEHNANVKAKDDYDRTVMMWAALHGSPEVVDLLCRLGVDLEQRDKDGNTALSEATKKGRSEIIKILENCLKRQGTTIQSRGTRQ
jgi:ankyrin repeat protein